MGKPVLPDKDILPVHQPNFETLKNPPNEGFQITYGITALLFALQPTHGFYSPCSWAGHASFLVQWDGMNLLTDPIFSERCSPVGFAGPKVSDGSLALTIQPTYLAIYFAIAFFVLYSASCPLPFRLRSCRQSVNTFAS